MGSYYAYANGQSRCTENASFAVSSFHICPGVLGQHPQYCALLITACRPFVKIEDSEKSPPRTPQELPLAVGRDPDCREVWFGARLRAGFKIAQQILPRFLLFAVCSRPPSQTCIDEGINDMKLPPFPDPRLS